MNRHLDIAGEFRDLTLLKSKVRIAILFLLLALLFSPIIVQLVKVWSTKGDYSHGFFVTPIAFYMAWKMRKELVSLSSNPTWFGLPVFAVGSVTYVVSFVSKFHTLTHISMVIILIGLLVFLGGWTVTKKLLFPVLFLLFMFPIPESYYVLITNPLKLIITQISTGIINVSGIPVYREGNLLYLASTQLEVAEACSGIRALYSYLMLGCLFAFISEKRKSKIVLLASTVPLALLVNIMRVTGTGILANYFGPSVSQGFFHQFTGFVLFIFGFVVLFLEYYLLNSSAGISKSQ